MGYFVDHNVKQDCVAINVSYIAPKCDFVKP